MSVPMAQLRGVSFAYTDERDIPGPAILTDVNLTLDEGELVLVAGRTGSGKSTLLGMFNALVPQFTGGLLDGDVEIAGRSIKGVRPRDLAQLVGFVAQDPSSGFVADTVEEELAYGMEQLGLDAATMRRRVEETLDLLGLAHLRHRSLRALSGGQQQRVAIGAVLTMHPSMLVLDEPTSALDPTAAEDVLATIARLVDDLGLTVVIAEHRMERVIPFIDRMVIVDGGRVQSGDPAVLLADSPVAPPLVEVGRLFGWQPLPLSVRAARRRVRERETPLASPVPAPVPELTAALSAKDISVAYGRTVAVREVDLRVGAGEVLALMGRNGSGKSTLLWALQGSGKRHSGTALIDGVDPHDVSATEARMLMGLVPQTASDLLYLESVADECAAADQQAGVDPGSARALLDRLAPGIPDSQHPRDLSEGQRLSLVLAIMLVARPHVLALDEPTRGLDYAAKAALAEVIASLAEEGCGVIVSTHDVEFVARIADSVMVLASGEVVSCGPTAKVLRESPAFAPQVAKILGPGWLTVEQLESSLAAEAGGATS